MKTMIHQLGSITVLGVFLVTANMAVAQMSQTTTTTTTRSAGTITEFTPDTVTIQTQTSAAPVQYTTTKTTTYVDENGNPIAIETVKSGLPVTVYYDTEGNQMVATKVVVRKSDLIGGTTQQTTTTTMGTVSDFTPDTIVVKSDTSSSPVTYSYTKSTSYVDENGNPVSIETVKSGLPVTVYYDKEGNRMVATKVIVRKSEFTTEPDGTVIEHNKTTTSTTTSPAENPGP